LMHHFKAPHDMFENAPRYDEYLANVEIPEPASLYNQPKWGSIATKGANNSLVNEVGTSVSKRHRGRNMGIHMEVDQSLADNEYTHQSYQKYLKRYLRTVKGVDDNLKRLLDHLKAAGEYENTVIIYTADQGMMLGEHDLIDKRWMYEPSLRMPFIVRHPKKINAPKVNDTMINNTDFAPLMLDIAGIDIPNYMHGKSFLNVFDNKALANWRDATYYRYWMHRAHHDVPSHFGIRSNDFKLIFFYGVDYNFESTRQATPAGWELYDLKNDPEELHNRYNDPAYKYLITELKSEMLAQRQVYGETDVNYPHIQEIIDKHWND